jgi:hypothetical protein
VTRRLRLAALLLAALASLALPGCAKVRERQAIRTYARGTAAANQKLRALRDLEAVLAERLRTGKVAVVKSFLKDRYLPAFAAYLEAVRAVPVETDRLRAIHGDLVKALERAHEAHAIYQEQVTAQTLMSAWQELVRVKLALSQDEERYRKAIAAYYRENDVKLAGE